MTVAQYFACPRDQPMLIASWTKLCLFLFLRCFPLLRALSGFRVIFCCLL